MEISEKDRKVPVQKSLSNSDICSKQLSIIPGDEGLHIIGFKVKLNGNDAYSFALDNAKSKSADLYTTSLADSEKMSDPHFAQEHHNRSTIVRNFRAVPNTEKETLPQTEINTAVQFKKDLSPASVIQLKLTSNYIENKDFEVHVKSIDTKDSTSENARSSSDYYGKDQLVGFSGTNPQTSYRIKSPTVPLNYITEIATSETQTERETESSSVQTADIEVRQPRCTKEIASQTDERHNVSTITEEKNTNSVEIETDAILAKQIEIQTDKEMATGSSQSETAALYSIDRVYDAATQTEQVEDAGTSTDFDIYIVDRENVTEKVVDTEDLPFAPLIIAAEEKADAIDKLSGEQSCYCSCGHRNHNRCIYKCCFHKEYRNMVPTAAICCPYQRSEKFSNLIPQCNLCHCPPTSNCDGVNKCEENFRFDIHQLHCCKCKNLNKPSDTETHQEVTQRLKAPESIRMNGVDFDSFAVQEKVNGQSKLEIGKTLKQELKKVKTIIAVKLSQPLKVEKVQPLQIPVVFKHYLSSFDLSTYKPSRVVINPVGITLSINKTTDFEEEKEAQLKSNVKSYTDGRTQDATSENYLLMFYDGKKSKPVIFSPRSKTFADDKHSQVCLCSKCFSNVHNIVHEKQLPQQKSALCGSDKEKSKSRRTAEDQSRGTSTSPKIKHKYFDYTSKDMWRPYKRRSDEVLSKKVEEIDVIYAGESSSDESIERAKAMGLHDACEVVNDHLLSLRPIEENTVKKAAETLHKQWLEMAGSKYSDAQEVRNYIKYFEEFSNNLLKTLLHCVDNNENNVLHFAFANNRFDLVKVFLNNGLATDLLKKVNKTGNSPLMICSISQPKSEPEWSVVRRAFEIGDVNMKCIWSGQTPLMNASSCGFKVMVDMLLDLRSNPNLQDKDGSTALMYAAEHGHENCIKSLVNHKKCDPTIKDKDGQTACSIALANGHKNIAVLIHMKALERRRLSKNLDSGKRQVWTDTKNNVFRKIAQSMPVPLRSVSEDDP